MNHHNTILGQILDLVSRKGFERLVKKHKTEFGAKGLKSWTQFVAMVFGQLSGQHGLRSLEYAMNSQRGTWYHMGMDPEGHGVKRSSLSYANRNRDAGLFMVCDEVEKQYQIPEEGKEAGIYRDRWQIELFFKAIKQNLKIKRFYGNTKNAVVTQIWIALIVYMLVYLMKVKAKTMDASFTNFISVIKTMLFQRRSLLEWLWGTSPPLKPVHAVTGGQLDFAL